MKQVHNENNVYIAKTKNKGISYFAKKDFKKGNLVLVVDGKTVDKPTDYTIPIGNGKFIDPTEYGGKFLNDHGQDANLGVKNRTQLIAMRDIKKDEEVGPAYFMFVPFYVQNSTADKLKLSSFESLSEKDKIKFKESISDYLFDENEIKTYHALINRK